MTARTLVVDDEPDAVELIAFNLKGADFSQRSGSTLTISWLESGPTVINLERFQLRDLVSEVCDDLADRARGTGLGLAIVKHIVVTR